MSTQVPAIKVLLLPKDTNALGDGVRVPICPE